MKQKPKILVTGATGQIGTALVPALRRVFGAAQVVVAGHQKPLGLDMLEEGPHSLLEKVHLKIGVRQ